MMQTTEDRQAAQARKLQAIADLARLVYFFVGVVLLSAGAWWIYPPAGLIVGGALLWLKSVPFVIRRTVPPAKD